MYYVHTDHLGSLNVLTNASAAIVQETSYDAWGNRRDPATLQNYTTPPTNLITDRGFTGHEHLDAFKLINMNGRIYDPALGRFLSPDNYVQAPDFTQSYNRYSYCMNNPLMFTDPSGMYRVADDDNGSSGAGETSTYIYSTTITNNGIIVDVISDNNCGIFDQNGNLIGFTQTPTTLKDYKGQNIYSPRVINYLANQKGNFFLTTNGYMIVGGNGHLSCVMAEVVITAPKKEMGIYPKPEIQITNEEHKLDWQDKQGLMGIGGTCVLVAVAASGEIPVIEGIAHTAAVVIDGYLLYQEIKEYQTIQTPKTSDKMKLTLSIVDFFAATYPNPGTTVFFTINQVRNAYGSYDEFFKKFDK